MYSGWHTAQTIYLPVLYTTQKVRDIWPSGEIYGKCKKFTLQGYYIMKVGHLSRSIQWWFPHLKQFIETKANNSGEYTTTKMPQYLVMCPWASITARQLMASKCEQHDGEDCLNTNSNSSESEFIGRHGPDVSPFYCSDFTYQCISVQFPVQQQSHSVRISFTLFPTYYLAQTWF